MKHSILFILITFASINLAYAQEPQKVKYKNPFEQLGYKNVKVATLSKGKYQEFHDLDSIVQIGSTLINTNTRQIVGFVTNDTTKQSQNASVPSRWMSIDPLADEFYNWSPYNFCFDNPIRYVDPDGREADDVILGGKEKQKAFEELQKAVKNDLTLSMDSEGKVTYTLNNSDGKISEDAKQLTNAIDDKSVIVNVTAEDTKFTSTGKPHGGAAFMGNRETKEKIDGKRKRIANQEINPLVLSKADKATGNEGSSVLHEVTEAYQGALIGREMKIPVVSPAMGANAVYNEAHNNRATPQRGAEYFKVTFLDNNGSKVLNVRMNNHRQVGGWTQAQFYVQPPNKEKTVLLTYTRDEFLK